MSEGDAILIGAGLISVLIAFLNQVWWHVTEIRVISVFPVHIIVKQEWWE